MFRDECKKLGFTQGGGGGGPPTHVLMDGGVLYIPEDRTDAFYRLCIHCINNFEKIYVVEQKTTLFNFFVDIDYQDSEPLSIEQVESVSKIICDKVDSYKPAAPQHDGARARAVVSISAPKPKGSKTKTGIHINFPGFVVDRENAVNLMNALISTLNLVYSARDWALDIDASVYGSVESNTKGSGFRMPWSHKKGKHDHCAGKGCVACSGTGKIVEGEYLPIFRYANGGTFEVIDDQAPTLELLKDTSIRVPAGAGTSAVIDATASTAASFPAVFRLPKNKREEEGGFSPSQVRNEVADPVLVSNLENFIRKNFQGQANSRISNVFKMKTSYYAKTNSRYCENIRRDHSSNHVWFVISSDRTVAQRCFCTCITLEGRMSGVLCRDFTGRRHNLNKTLSDKLYPNKILTTSKKEALLCSFF